MSIENFSPILNPADQNFSQPQPKVIKNIPRYLFEKIFGHGTVTILMNDKPKKVSVNSLLSMRNQRSPTIDQQTVRRLVKEIKSKPHKHRITKDQFETLINQSKKGLDEFTNKLPLRKQTLKHVPENLRISKFSPQPKTNETLRQILLNRPIDNTLLSSLNELNLDNFEIGNLLLNAATNELISDTKWSILTTMISNNITIKFYNNDFHKNSPKDSNHFQEVNTFFNSLVELAQSDLISDQELEILCSNNGILSINKIHIANIYVQQIINSINEGMAQENLSTIILNTSKNLGGITQEEDILEIFNPESQNKLTDEQNKILLDLQNNFRAKQDAQSLRKALNEGLEVRYFDHLVELAGSSGFKFTPYLKAAQDEKIDFDSWIKVFETAKNEDLHSVNLQGLFTIKTQVTEKQYDRIFDFLESKDFRETKKISKKIDIIVSSNISNEYMNFLLEPNIISDPKLELFIKYAKDEEIPFAQWQRLMTQYIELPGKLWDIKEEIFNLAVNCQKEEVVHQWIEGVKDMDELSQQRLNILNLITLNKSKIIPELHYLYLLNNTSLESEYFKMMINLAKPVSEEHYEYLSNNPTIRGELLPAILNSAGDAEISYDRWTQLIDRIKETQISPVRLKQAFGHVKTLNDEEFEIFLKPKE